MIRWKFSAPGIWTLAVADHRMRRRTRFIRGEVSEYEVRRLVIGSYASKFCAHSDRSDPLLNSKAPSRCYEQSTASVFRLSHQPTCSSIGLENTALCIAPGQRCRPGESASNPCIFAAWNPSDPALNHQFPALACPAGKILSMKRRKRGRSESNHK